FVDAAVVSAAALGGTGAAIVVELGLHHVAATLIERDGGPTCRRRSLVSARGGLWLLYQGWLDLINTAMVRQTRFDALHDAATEPVRLLRRLPSGAEPALAALVERESAQADAPWLAPSHVLFAGRTFALGDKPLVVGRAPGAGHAITLAEGLAGVSRRHCTFLRDGAQLLLLDHSRFGSFVNGERVAERVRVRAGDEVRIGDPGVALTLIAVADTPPGSRG